MKILSIDYGAKRIGLAISDENEILASRFKTLENRGDKKAAEEIKRICLNEKIEKIIVGLPIGFKGESGQSEIIRKFIGELKKNIDMPIVEVNEIFTSKMGEENLREAGVKDIKKVLDQEAARIVLQDYLEKEPNNESRIKN